MSTVTIKGTLILDGDLSCSGTIHLTSSGVIIPVPDENLKKSYWSEESNSYITSNGCGRTITSTTGDIIIDGLIDGYGGGFESDQGPGANSAMVDSLGAPLIGFGGTHAGRGAIRPKTGSISFVIEEFLLKQQDIDRKYVRILGRPIQPDLITLNIIGGIAQVYGVDFFVDSQYGTYLRWDNMALESLLAPGDRLRVTYLGNTDPIIPPAIEPYGNMEAPVSLGSGSGYYHDPLWYLGTPSNGGGAIKLVARSGIVRVDGVINMNGMDSEHSGGGAGGSIWLWGWVIQGSGSLLAEGGSTRYDEGGGGGGGYISLWYELSDNFTGNISVIGKVGAEDGKIYRKPVEPIMVEKFTGRVWNVKWWDHTGQVYLDNSAVMCSAPPDQYYPLIDASFSLSGRNITIACDSLTVGPEREHYSAFMRLYFDKNNWVAVMRRKQSVWGVSMENGLLNRYAAPVDYTNLSMRIMKMDSTFIYQFWTADMTSPQTICTDVLPGLQNKIFTLQLGLEQIEPKDATRVDYYRLINANITNQTLFMDGTPSMTPAMNIITGTSQYYGLDFYTSGNKIRWDTSGLSTFIPADSLFIIDYFVLSPTDIYNKFIELSKAPSTPNNIAVDVVGAGPQYYGLDFIVIDNRLIWAGLGLEPDLRVGDELRVEYYYNSYSGVVPLVELFEPGDQIRVVYSLPIDATDTYAAFDNFRVYEGIIDNAESKDSVLYVDPSKGSDRNDGRQLSPLQNLFVATAWSMHGGTVVLYDGTHNPTEVIRKNITIRGAYGADAYITSSNVLDSTGSGWEENALSFHHCQGLVENVKIGNGRNGVLIDYSPDFEVRNSEMFNLSTGVKSINCDPVVMRNKIYNSITAFDFSSCTNAYVYSNVIHDCTYGVCSADTTNLIISSNTIDNCLIGVCAESESKGVVSSNSITWDGTGILISSDSVISSFNNNFYGDGTEYFGVPDQTNGNINLDPFYYSQPDRDYHLLSNSPNINRGLGTYDNYYVDYDGVNRGDSSSVDIGAFEFVDTTHSAAQDWYVAGAGDDYLNSGDATRPFRTLDKALQVADATIHIDGGHYDSYYLSLRSQTIDLNQLTILTAEVGHFVSYITVTSADMTNGYIRLPGFVQSPSDASMVSVNVIGGPTQLYGKDYVIHFGALVWRGYGLDGFVDVGDTFRIVYGSPLQRKALNTLVLHSHYSNVDVGRMIIVSPSGSDSTVLGGDGTNSGGNGTWERPYRTVQMALNNSSVGDNIILRAGEYPLFTPQSGRVLVPYKDRTSVSDKGLGWESVEDFFSPVDFRSYGTPHFDEIPWTFDYTGRSSVTVNAGYMSFIYDGTNIPSAVSKFVLHGEFDAMADLRAAIDPLYFVVSSTDDTAFFRYDNASFVAGTHTGGIDSSCWGFLSVPEETTTPFVIEESVLTSDDIRNKSIPLSKIPEPSDCTSIALNIIGGVPQCYGEDFSVRNAMILWDGMGLDGELEPGDKVRVMYKDRSVSGPVRVWISMRGGIFKIRVNDGTWRTVMQRNMLGDSSSWRVSFFMSDPDYSVKHDCESGRGFVSRFVAISDSINGTSVSMPYSVRTERRTVIFYKE